MNKVIPFSQFIKQGNNLASLSNTSVIVDGKNTPLGFVFGRDAFISLCTTIDNEFDKRVTDPKKAYDNPAGKLIDLIEEKLPVNPAFAKDLELSIKEAKKSGWIPFKDVVRTLHV